jgi:hypothetical protein
MSDDVADSDEHDRSASEILSFLRLRGFDAERVPEINRRQPDILVKAYDGSILIEVKDRNEVDGLVKRWRRHIELHGSVMSDHRLERSDAVSSFLENGISQLQKHADSEKALKLLWIRCAGVEPEAQELIILFGVYGMACVIDPHGRSKTTSGSLPAPDSPWLTQAIATKVEPFYVYYFHDSDFFARRGKLDGIFLEAEDRLTLLINDHSVRAEQLRKCQLRELATGVYDPVNILDEHELYADCENPRGDQSETLKHLAEKYGLIDLRLIPMRGFTQTTQVPEKSR